MKVAIFGAGTMGSGIAQVFAAKGHTALMYASSVASAQKHKDKLAASLAKRVAKGKMTQEAVDALLANILVEEKSACADADLIIECVKEDMATKKELLCELDELCKPEAIFASNTSSLSITEMGNGLKHPVIGMHFFNPVPSMKLVEIIRGANTTQETFDFVYKLSQEIGKEPVEVAEAPGFVVNKILIPMINEAIGLVETGVASVADIDKAMQLGAKVVTMSDSTGWIYDAEGLDLDAVKEIKEVKRARLSEYKNYRPNAEYHEGKGVWSVKCDVALPCATQNELNLDDAKALVANGCIAVAEGANMPTTLEATEYLQKNGILFAPGKAANAGGVATSALEMSQNSERLSWTFEEVDQKLKQIMTDIFAKAAEAADRYDVPGDYVAGANIAGFEKVANAMLAQGV